MFSLKRLHGKRSETFRIPCLLWFIRQNISIINYIGSPDSDRCDALWDSFIITSLLGNPKYFCIKPEQNHWFLNEFLLFCDSWQDEKHPEVNSKEQDDLEDDFAHDRLSEVEGTVHNHGPELDQHHDQERAGHLILRQRWRDVCRRVFLDGMCTNFNVVSKDFGR